MRRRMFNPALAFALLLGGGAAVRLLSGTPLLQTDLVYSGIAPSGRQGLPGTRTPGDAALTFYLALDRGDYTRAYNTAIEPDWTGGRGDVSLSEEVRRDPAAFSGWTLKERFVERCTKELGPDGSGIRLNNIVLENSEELPQETLGEGLPVFRKPTSALSGDRGFPLPFRLEKGAKVFRVKVSGHILGACSIFRWEKTLVAVQQGRDYRVLLDGTKEPRNYFYQSWFANILRYKNLRE